eukprot:COSAG01_NODE_23749_length_803_cov_0.985795_1_plen_175_part_10
MWKRCGVLTVSSVHPAQVRAAVEKTPSGTPLPVLLSSTVDARLQDQSFGAILQRLPAPKRHAFQADARRQLMEAAIVQSVQQQTNTWLEEQSYADEAASALDAPTVLDKALHDMAQPDALDPAMLAVFQSAQRNAVLQAQQTLANQEAERAALRVTHEKAELAALQRQKEEAEAA